VKGQELFEIAHTNIEHQSIDHINSDYWPSSIAAIPLIDPDTAKKSDITVDYGENVCDNFAFVTQDGVTKEIKLRGRRQ